MCLAKSAPLRAADRPACEDRPQVAPAIARLREALAHGRFVAYEPTSLTVLNGQVTPAQALSIRADLAVLRRGFDGLITYDAIHGSEALPAIAVALGFGALIIGVWDPLDERQIEAAIEAVHHYPRLVAGISLGNELIFSRRTAGFSEERQASFYRELRKRLPHSSTRAFTYFAAFDAPWRAFDALAAPVATTGIHPEEAHWGLYDAQRRSKIAARELGALATHSRSVSPRAPAPRP